MNKPLVFFASILTGMALSHAQNKQLLYDFYEIPQALKLNPGVRTPYQWHAGVPLLSAISAQAGTSGITVNDLFANDGLDFTTKVRDRAVNGLSQNDEFGGSFQVELFYAGFRNGNRPNDYYSFGVYGEGFIAQYWPRDLAILAFEGNATNIGRRFSFDHIATQGELVNVFHFGINRKLNEKWTVGARAKLYSSIFEFKSRGNDGFFITTQGENNILRNTVVADVRLRTSGIEGILDDDNGTAELASLLTRRALLGGNLGVGLDLGITHKLGKRSYITASLLDLGFIYHSKDIKNYTFEGAATNEGIEFILPDDLDNLNGDIGQELIDELEELLPFETNENGWISLRPTKFYGSYRYNFGLPKERSNNCDCDITPLQSDTAFDYVNALGAQVFAINRPRGPQTAITAFYQRRLGKVLALKATYTADKFTLSNIGLGMNIQAGPFHFYILADNLLGYQNIPDSNYASLQFGFNIISWKSK